jgi:hypothetical protein
MHNRYFKYSLPVLLKGPTDIFVHHGILLRWWHRHLLKVPLRCNVLVLSGPKEQWVEQGCFLPLCFQT